MTPDPSLAPVAVWVTGYAPQGEDLVRELLALLIVFGGFAVFSLVLIAAAVGLRR